MYTKLRPSQQVAIARSGGERWSDLYNHLRDARPPKRPAPDKGLLLESGEEVAGGGQGQEERGGDQRGGVHDQRQPLDEAHGAVGGSAHVVGRDLADGGVKRRRGRADSQEEGHLDEEDDEGACPIAESQRPRVL